MIFWGSAIAMPLAKVMIIRHGEKPTVKHQPPYGVTADGEQDWESLTVRGWLRAGALETLFAPSRGPLPNHLAKPSVIYASKPRSPGVAADSEASRSKRPLQTVSPLAEKLGLAPRLPFGKGDEKALAAEVLQQTGVVLICWQHERIAAIAAELVGKAPPGTTIPSDWPDDRFDLVWVLDPPAGAIGRWSFFQVPENLLSGDQDRVFV
jgi:hypothetical protein